MMASDPTSSLVTLKFVATNPGRPHLGGRGMMMMMMMMMFYSGWDNAAKTSWFTVGNIYIYSPY